MATKYASATGAWSTMVWWTTSAGTTTTTAPGVGDDADLNGKTVTLDQDVTCASIIGSGTLSVSGTRTVTANLGAADAWTLTLLASQTLNSIGNVTGCTTGNRLRTNSSTAVLNHTGNVTGGSGSGAAVLCSSGNASIVGSSVTGGTATNALGANCAGGTLTINATVTGGSASGASGLSMSGGTVNLTGSLVDATSSAYRKDGGTLNYTPTNAQTATIGGKTLYPTTGGLVRAGAINGGMSE